MDQPAEHQATAQQQRAVAGQRGGEQIAGQCEQRRDAEQREQRQAEERSGTAGGGER